MATKKKAVAKKKTVVKATAKKTVKKAVRKVASAAVAEKKMVKKVARVAVKEVRKHPKETVGLLAGLAALGAGMALMLGMKKRR